MPIVDKDIPLCVDLDGALTYTDILVETYIQLLKEKPWVIFQTPFWILKGKAILKAEISRQVHFDPTILPYNQELLDWLKAEKAAGRTLCLATASNIRIGEKVAEYLGIFDHVICSTDATNLLGIGKAHVLVEKFGEKQFDYVGDSAADLLVWPKAREAILVNASERTASKAHQIAKVSKVFESKNSKFRFNTFLKQIRIHQWIKNTLVFIPALAGHTIFEPSVFLSSLIAFFSFSFAASSIYILNDVFDLNADRHHSFKKHRPLASGTFSLRHAIFSFWILLFGSLILSFALPQTFILLLLTYYVINLAYTFRLKRVAYIDVVLLTSVYVIRVLAGSAASSTDTSVWLFSFAACFFFSLALVKRCSELINMEKAGKEKAVGRGYSKDDSTLLRMLGIVSAILSVVILGIYVLSSTATLLYTQPIYLFGLVILLAFWLGRTWILTLQGNVHEDPVLFATKDVPSYIVACIAIAIILLAVRPL